MSSYVQYAKRLGITIQNEWFHNDENNPKKKRLDWASIPKDIAVLLRTEASNEKARHERRRAEPKSKFCFVKGRTRKETKRLRKQFIQANADLPLFNYPKE